MKHKFSLFVALSAICISGMAIRANAASAEPGAPGRKFEHAELFAGTSSGQKKAGGSTKGVLVFNSEKKTVEFQREKSGDAMLSIPYGQIKSLLYEQTAKPRYTEAVLISPMFLLAHSKKHYLTIQYTDMSGRGSMPSCIWTRRMPKRHSQPFRPRQESKWSEPKRSKR